MHSHAPPIIDELFNQLAFPFARVSSKILVYRRARARGQYLHTKPSDILDICRSEPKQS
jgi:hypothetical protein